MNRFSVVIITDSVELSKSIFRYIRYVFGGEIDAYYGKYDESFLSRELFDKVDVFILESHRFYEKGGLRNEGVSAGRKYLEDGKRVLIFPTLNLCPELESPILYNPARNESLKEKILDLVSSPPASPEEIDKIKDCFPSYYSPDHHHHHG